MPSDLKIFHLAIPCHDLDAAERFYADGLGGRRARRRDDRVTFDFFGHQLVCHLAPEAVDEEPRAYPRHFGITFGERADFEAVRDRARRRGLPFFSEPAVRFAGERDEHTTFFLCDSSNNLVEFKHYRDPAMMY